MACEARLLSSRSSSHSCLEPPELSTPPRASSCAATRPHVFLQNNPSTSLKLTRHPTNQMYRHINPSSLRSSTSPAAPGGWRPSSLMPPKAPLPTVVAPARSPLNSSPPPPPLPWSDTPFLSPCHRSGCGPRRRRGGRRQRRLRSEGTWTGRRKR